MEKSPGDEVLGSQEEPTQAPVLTTQERMFRTEDSNEVTENLVMDLENGSDLQNEEQRGQQEDMDAPVLDINGRAYADGTFASTTTVATESGSSKIDGGRSSSFDEKEEDVDLVEFHKRDRDQNGGDTYPDPPKKRETAVEDVDPSRNFQNRQFEEKRDEHSSLQEEMLGKELDQPEKVVETVPPTSRNETQTLASREGKRDHDSQLEEPEKRVEDGISQSNGTAKKTEEYVETGHGSSQVEIDGDDTDRYDKRDSDVVNLPLKEETGNSMTVKAIDSIAGTERQIEADSQLEEGRGNGGNDMSQGDETLQKKEEIVENTSGNTQGETGGDQIDQWHMTDLNTVNSSSKSESENHGVYKIVKAIEDLQVGPEYIHGEVDHGIGHERRAERSDGFKGIVESESEGTHGVASGFADSKNDMQKETGISRHHHDSTKSLEQLDVQEDPNTEASLEDGSQFQFHNTLTGVEKVSEVKPVERIIDIEESKNNMQKETRISGRHTSTKSLQQLYVQEETNIEEPLKDGSQLQFHNNLTGVEEISEVKPVERIIDIKESKNDMEKETGISERHTSTKSLEQSDVQEEPNTEELLKDGSQLQFHNNLTGVEEISELKPVERIIDIEESKNDMQKETGISERHTSTKSLEQSDVQVEPIIEEPLKDGSQLQFHNNLTGVEEISELKPVERNIDIDESKNDMQKETGIRHHRPTSTKSLEQLDVQEEPIIEEPLEDGNQFQLYNNLTGVEEISEVKPVERNIDIDESKIDMQKETGIRHHRPTSTKSLEQLDVQEEPIIEEPLEDGSQFQLYNNLKGVEEISEVKPVERNIEVEENVEARNGKVKEINTGVTTVVDRESRVGATTYTLSSTVETYRTSVVYSKKDGLLLQRESGSTQTPSALIENSDHADTNHPRLKIVHQFPRETKIGEEHPVGAHEASTSKPVEGESESELEKILRLQQTHDLLCPNCGSCITKRVVLRKRKRTTAVSVDKWEQEVLDQETSVQLAEHAEDEVPMEEYEETEDWGCLGCFTFLFRRVRGFRRRAGLATLEEARAVTSDSNCLPILFKWRRKAPSGLLTPLLRHDESSEVTTRSRELPAEEAETAELREQLETSLLGENVQIPVIVYESAMLEKTQDQFCFPFSWSRTTKTAKVTQALQEPLLGQPQIEDFTQVPDQLTLPTEYVSKSVAPDGPSATSSSSVMVGTPDVFSERGSPKPLVTVPLGERDADCNCLPSFPWGPSGRTLDQKDLVKQEEQVPIVVVDNQAIRGEPHMGSDLFTDARIKDNEPIEATVFTVGSLHVPLSPTVASPALPEVSIPLLSNEGSRSSEVTGTLLTSSKLEEGEDRFCLPLSWSRTTRITKDTREGRKEKTDSISTPVKQTSVRRFESDDTVTRTIISEVITLPQPHKGAEATAEDARQMKVTQREDSKCLPLSLPTRSWRRRQENKADDSVEEKENQSRLLKEEEQLLLQESSKNKLQETGQEYEETRVWLSQDPHLTEYYRMRTELMNDLGEEEPLVRKVHKRQLTKDQLELLKQDKEAAINALVPMEKPNPLRLYEPNEGGEPMSEKLQKGKQEENAIEVTRIHDAHSTYRHEKPTTSMTDLAEEELLLRNTQTQEWTEDQLGQEPIAVEIADHIHPESIPPDHTYFGGLLPVEQLPRKAEHAAQEIKEGDFLVGRPIDYSEKEERNVPPQDNGTYCREEVREMGSWDCCLPAYSWSSTRTLEAERPAENTTVSKFMETSTLSTIQEATEVVTEETTKPLLGQPQEKVQIYLTNIADESLLLTELVSRSTPSGPSELSSSLVVNTPEVVAESGHSTPLVAAPVNERGADCNYLPTFSWGPSGRTLSQKDAVKQEKEVLINEVVDQPILSRPPVVASRERQLLADVGTKEEEPNEASVITVVSTDVPLSPTFKSPPLHVDRVEDESPRVVTEQAPSVRRKPDIFASIVPDIEGEVLATSSLLEPEVISELPEVSGIELRRERLNCMDMCIPSYPWGSKAGTTRRERTTEKNSSTKLEPSSLERTQKDVEVVTQETVEPPLGQEVGEPHTEDHTRIKDDIRPPTEEFSVSDGVKEEKDVLIHEVVDQVILTRPLVEASGERQLRADIDIKEEEPTEGRVIMIGSIDVPLSPTVKSPSLSGDRMEDETLRAQTEPTPSVEQKPYISTSIVVDTEGEVVAISRNLELGVTSELSEEFGIDDAPRKAGLNCIGLCIPSYPWGPEAGTARRDEPKEKLESIAVQIDQSTAGKFVSDRGTRTIPQPHQEAATTETSTEGLIGREVVLPMANLSSIGDARQIKVIQTEDSKCLPLPTFSWSRRSVKTVEFFEEETPSRLSEPSEGAPHLPQQKMEKLQGAEQENDEVEALRSQDPQSTKQDDMDKELMGELTEEEPLVRKARVPAATEDQIEKSKEDNERLHTVSTIAPEMIKKEKTSTISGRSGGEHLSQVAVSQEAGFVEQHDMQTASMDDLADEQPLVRQRWELTEDPIKLLKQETVGVDSVSALTSKINEKDNEREQSESIEEAPSFLQKEATEKLQRAEQEEEKVEVLLREPQTQELIQVPVIVLAPKMNQQKKPRRLPMPSEEGEPLFKGKEYKVEVEDAGIEVPDRQDPYSTECHFDMHPDLMDDLAEEELLTSKARISKLREDLIKQSKQDAEGLVPLQVQKARTREKTEDQVALLQQGPGEQEPRGLEIVANEIKEEDSSRGRLITQIEREEEYMAPHHVGTYYKEEVREMGSWDCCLPAYSWRSTRTLEAERPAETTIVATVAEPSTLEKSREVNHGVTTEQTTIDARITTTTTTYFKDSTDKDHAKDVESVKVDTAVSFVKPSYQYEESAIKSTLYEAMKGLSDERMDEIKRQDETSISEIPREMPQHVVPPKLQYSIWPWTSRSVGTEDNHLRESLLREEEKSGADSQDSSVHVSVQQTHQVRETKLPISQMPETDGRTVFTDEESIGDATCGCLPPRWISLRADAAVPSVSVRERTSMDELQQPLLHQAEPDQNYYRAKGMTTIEEEDVTTTAVRVTTDNTVIEVQGGDAAGTLEAATVAAEEAGVVMEAEASSQEYLKSIVYGGLEVSLTSLGVVASAAGGGAKTRTVLALGLANLVFGVIAFYHKIINFHRDQPAYFKMSIGQRFWRSSILAILSFVVFGSLPPLTYGFSFRQRNDSDYKMAATVAVSVVAIVLLGCGKVAAKMTEQSYVRTLSALIFTGVVAAVAGFYTGDYASKLLEKFGFDAD